MKKYLFIFGILIAFFALTVNSPAITVKYDDQEISWNDDTIKVTKKTVSTSDAHEKTKGGCDPAKCEKLCGKKAATKPGCCPGKSNAKDPKQDPDKK